MDQSGVYDHGSHQGLTNRNNGLAGSYAQTRSNSERHLWGRNNAGAPLAPVNGNFTSDVGMVNGSFTQSGSSQAGYTDFEWDDLLTPDLTPVSFTSLLNGGDNLFQVPQYGTPACSRPLYNFNSPARRDAGGSVCESSCQTVPSTPSLCRTVQENGFLEKITTTGHEITEPKSDKSVQSIVDSSVVNSTKGSKSIEFDLNKTPQQKPSKRKKKFMPKVVVEGKPKRKPRKPATPENVKSKETGSGKRKRAQKTNLKESASKKPANVGDMCSPEVTLKSCRKALNFDLEKTGDARQGDSESVEKSCGSSSFSEIRDASGGTNGSFLDSVRNQPDKLSTGAKLPRVLEDHTRILARDKQPEQCQFPVATQNTQFPVGNQQAWLQMKNQLNGFPFGNQLSRMTTRNYLAMGNQKPMCLVGTPPPALASGNQQLGGLQGNKQPIFLNQQTCISAGNRQYESPTGMGFTHLNQMVAAYMSSPGLRPHSQSQIPATNQHVESVSRSFNETAGTCQRSSIPEYGSLRKDIHQENEYIPSHERSSAECLDVYKKALSQNSSPPTPVMAKLDEAKGSKRQYHRAMGQTQNDDLNLAGQWHFLQHIPQSQDVDRQIAKSQDLKRQNRRKKMKIQKVFQDNLHSMPPEVVDIEDDPTDGARKDKNTASVVETVSTGITCLVQKSADNENCIVPKTPARKGRAGRKKSVPPLANASEIQRCQPTLPKTPSTRSTAKKKGTKSMQDSEKTRGPSEEFLSQDLMVEIINTMHNLNLGEKGRNQEQNALVLYRGDGAVVPYESKKRKPRPKVDLDDETTRTWNLLMGKGDKNEEMDKKKEKWWEEERRVFRGRADSFIARMHLVQGDRRFSPWKGSVVDSVIGVFLTQNVTDHLSSSAFMSLAARFPPKSSSNQEDGRSIKSVIVEDPEGCILNLNDIPSLQEKVQNPSDTQVSGVDSGQNLEEEILSSQDSFDPAIFQSCGRVGSCSCSKSDAEFSTTRCETKTVGGSAQSVQTGSPNLSDEIFLKGNERPLLYEGSGDVQIQETANVAQKKPDLEKTMNWKDSLSFGQPSNDTNWQNEGPTNASSSYEQSAVGQPQVVDIEDFGMQDEGLGYSWLSISQSVDRGKNKNAPRRFRRFFREGGRVPKEFTGKIIPSTPHEIPGMGLSASSSTNQMHQGDVQHNQQCGTQQNEMNKAPHFFMDLLNSAEECLTRQCSTTDNIMDDLLLRDKTTKDVVDQLIKNSSLRNTLVESSSSKKEQTAVEYNETNPTVVREMKGMLADGKKPTSQWDSLRKDVEGNVGRKERSKDSMDSIDYEAIRRASISEISESIKERGMNNMLAVRIKDFLERIVKDHGGVDLEWLRDVPADKAKDYLLSIRGLGLKSVECVRLLTLHNLAFPVDTNVGRIAVRLGWVPLQPLPESLQLHLLELYPVLESIQKFLWPRLCKLDQRTLYELHYQLITFGKVFCTKSKPNCNACPMRGECRHFASAYASARLALPAPDERSLTSAIIPVSPESFPPAALPMMELPPPLEKSLLKGAPSNGGNCEPVIEEPASPEQECTEITESDIEDAYYNEDPDEIPTIKLNIEQFGMTLREHIERNMGLQDGDMSKALVALNPTTTYIPTPKLKNISRLRTEHQVYELPDSHPLLDGMDRRERDDPSPYLLAIWTPGETANSAQPPEQKCGGQASGKMCFDETCSECNSVREAKSQTVRGTLLIPCRTAMRGSFPLNGTYFQVNELFADHDSSLQPIAVPRDLIWHLPRRVVYFGTSVTSIFKGLTTEQIQHCFWKGFVCVRGFEQKTRAPRPLMARLHFPASRLKSNKT